MLAADTFTDSKHLPCNANRLVLLATYHKTVQSTISGSMPPGDNDPKPLKFAGGITLICFSGNGHLSLSK